MRKQVHRGSLVLYQSLRVFLIFNNYFLFLIRKILLMIFVIVPHKIKTKQNELLPYNELALVKILVCCNTYMLL